MRLFARHPPFRGAQRGNNVDFVCVQGFPAYRHTPQAATRRLHLRLYSSAVNTIRFGTDGWRGVIADDFTFDNVRKVSLAIARYVIRAEKPAGGVLVGYDNRFGGERFARAAAETIAMTGTPVWLAGAPCPTPAISLLVRQRAAAGGIVITASHNPYRWSGIKFKASYGSSASPSIVAQIEENLGPVLAAGLPSLPARNDLIQPLDAIAP